MSVQPITVWQHDYLPYILMSDTCYDRVWLPIWWRLGANTRV